LRVASRLSVFLEELCEWTNNGNCAYALLCLGLGDKSLPDRLSYPNCVVMIVLPDETPNLSLPHARESRGRHHGCCGLWQNRDHFSDFLQRICIGLAGGPGFWNRNILHRVYPVEASKPFGGFKYSAQEVFDVHERVSRKVVLPCDVSSTRSPSSVRKSRSRILPHRFLR